MIVSDSHHSTESLNCQLMGKTQAICTGSSTGAAISGDTTEPPVQTATVSGSEVTFVPVVVTAGAATGKQTGSNATPSATAKTTASTISGSTSSTASTASTKTSTSSTSSASVQGTNAAMQASPAYGAGVLGALGVVVAGAML